jgi:hypothetical protein
MSELKIKTQSTANRCEICHQSDLFNLESQICQRCFGLNITKINTPTTSKLFCSDQNKYHLLCFFIALGTPIILTALVPWIEFSTSWVICPFIVSLLINRSTFIWGALTNVFLVAWVALVLPSLSIFRSENISIYLAFMVTLKKDVFDDPLDFLLPTIFVVGVGFIVGLIMEVSKKILVEAYAKIIQSFIK